MLPMKALRLQFGELLAADTTTLSQAANANELHLIAADFTLSEDLEVGDLVAPTFTGSANKDAGLNDQLVGVDPGTGRQYITIKAPVGGWNWECTVDPAAPETIYGIALTDNGKTTLFAVEKFAVPVVISAAGDIVQGGDLNIKILNPTAD